MSNCWKCGRELEFGVECEDGCLPPSVAPEPRVLLEPVAITESEAVLALVRHTVEVRIADELRIEAKFNDAIFEVIVRKVSP